MRLERAGENRFSGYAEAFKDREPGIEVHDETGTITLKVRDADGLGAVGRYEYVISLTAEDLARILDTVAKGRKAFDNGPLLTALAGASSSLFRLAVASTQAPFLMPATPRELKKQALKDRLSKLKSKDQPA